MRISLPGKLRFTAILILFAGCAVFSAGQEGRPEIAPHRLPQANLPQANKKPKGKDPRAVGILQLNGSKGTLVPVAILIDGRFYDASAYKADPIPMALESGTVYEVEREGDSQGFFTVNGALHSTTAGSANPWVGSGTYLPPGAEAARSTRKAENVPVGLNDNGDEPPRLTRKESSTKNDSAGSDHPAGDKTEGTGTASPKSGNGSASSGPAGQGAAPGSGTATGDKNTDHSTQPKSSSTSTGESSPPSSSQTPPAQTSPGQSPPGQTEGAKIPSPQLSPSAGSDQNYYRPTLRRGKPTTVPPPDEDEAATKKTGKVDAVATAAPAGAAKGADMKVMAAISDAGGPDPQSYKFFWKTGEEEERRGQMVTLAEKEVRAYAAALVKNQISAQASSKGVGSKTAGVKTTGAKTKASKDVQPVLENVQFYGFDVWLNNQLVMILTADAHLPSTSSDTSATPGGYSVTVVGRTDIYGNLQKLYTAVTDKFHLDVTPRLELIDVVDADGDGRGELLFRETTDAGNGYLIYRATADRLWKMFDSLNAE
jgi:hypothetical protein